VAAAAKMSPYEKVVRLEQIGIGGFLLAVILPLALGVPPFALLGIPVIAIPATMALGIRCPRCGKPVLGSNVKILGYEYYSWSGWPARRCRRCELPLDHATNTHGPVEGARRDGDAA
jgi:hypothetical protein